jgi:hypothetical protein
MSALVTTGTILLAIGVALTLIALAALGGLIAWVVSCERVKANSDDFTGDNL